MGYEPYSIRLAHSGILSLVLHYMEDVSIKMFPRVVGRVPVALARVVVTM